MANEISMKLIRTVGTLSKNEKGWKKQLKVISWNDAEAKYDLRAWNPGEDRSGKGITMTEEELRALFEIIRRELVHLEEVEK